MPRWFARDAVAMSKRKYAIRPGQPVFDAGVLPDGQQVLIGVQLPELVIVLFSADGALNGESVIPLPGSGSRVTIDEAVAGLAHWKAAVGFRAETIRVDAFFLQNRWIGIEDLPKHYKELLDHSEGLEEERRLELLEDVRQWKSRGDFVLYWDEDYYLDKDGEVVSS